MSSSRKQFTFYSSFYDSAKRIKNKAARADLYDTICRYAIDGVEPDLDKLPESVAVAFINAKPNLEASRRKAENGKQGGSKSKANASKPEANASKIENVASEKENEIEIEKEKEIEIENECYIKGGEASATDSEKSFLSFWDAYPCKIGKDMAWDVWQTMNPSESVAQKVMQGLDCWKQSRQWAEEGGRFIPRAAKFLADGYWMNPPAIAAEGIPKGASGQLGEAEMEAIQRMLSQEVPDGELSESL